MQHHRELAASANFARFMPCRFTTPVAQRFRAENRVAHVKRVNSVHRTALACSKAPITASPHPEFFSEILNSMNVPTFYDLFFMFPVSI
jgi:hypothetical protein